jgi:molybdenum cofactor cytidylyltransferase
MSLVAAVLLAAGKSRRMGAFKPLLPFGAQTVAESCIAALLDGGVGELVVVLGTRAEEMRERLSHLPVSFAVNAEAESEMAVSIARGVERIQAEAEALFVALCDQPAVPSWIIRLLIDERRRTGAQLILPEHEGRGGHPVLLDAGLRGELLELDQERGLRALFDRHRAEVLRVPVSSPYVARDMDTWDDYAALHLEMFGALPPVAGPARS